jgi:hypothetical protein
MFREKFSVDELISAIVMDVNQPEDDAQRIINRESLCKWAAGGEW